MNPADFIPAVLAVGVMLLVAFPIHEFSHAMAAFRLGDSTARYQGRLTLNPAVHFDPIGGTILAASTILGGLSVGWAKPTPVNPANLDGGRRGEALVALAGPLSNLVMAAIVAIPVRLIVMDPNLLRVVLTEPPTELAFTVMVFLVRINVLLFLFNLLPVPPLDGYRVLVSLVSPRTAWQLRQYEQYGFLLILLVVVLEIRGIGPMGLIGNALIQFLIGLPL